MALEQGFLALADISGYTKYLAAVELEHSHDILADLLNVVVRELTGAMELAKLEGDAVFCFTRGGRPPLLTLIEGCYRAFEERLRDIKNLTTCPCDACLRIPDLRLKFVAHHGSFVLHEVAGSRELVGSDVVVAHRLLKNSVTGETGLRGYALMTQACTDALAVEPSSVGLTRHDESYDDVGPIGGWLLDLEGRWADELERRAVFLGPGDAPVDVAADLPVPPPVAWDYATSPAKRARWQLGVLRIDQDNPNGVPGRGTVNHCVHGDDVVVEHVVDWKPFRYVTIRGESGGGTSLYTFEFQPVGDQGTRVSFRMRPEPPPEDDAQREALLSNMSMMIELAMRSLASTVQADLATAAGRAAAP